jgi:hypothetical protein
VIYNEAYCKDHMDKKGKESLRVNQAIEEVLSQIIDEWYERVAPHYVTREQQRADSGLPIQEELKRFHDETGHRIKFNKDELDFTYGLKSQWNAGDYIIEISVNNKVENFDYQEFEQRLLSHYQRKGSQGVPTPYELKKSSYRDIFQLEPNPEHAFHVERRQGKADIMSLSFRVSNRFIRCLASHPVSGKQLIEGYCVSPFRRLYATVYRRQHQ